MADILVHVLNFHGICFHIEIVLENKSVNPHSYYRINRWDDPQSDWASLLQGNDLRYDLLKDTIVEASSVYSFNIEAEPDKIVKSWNNYWGKTEKEAHVLGKNCAVAAQRT